MYIAPIFDARKSGLSFAKRTYLPRVAGLGLGFICVCAALYPLAPPTAVWLLLAFHGFLWPHLAYRLACRAKDPFKAEIRNLLIDSAFGGFWAAMMAFNALPAIVILSMMSMNNIASAGKALFVKGLAIQLAAAADRRAARFPVPPAQHAAANLSVPADDLPLSHAARPGDLPHRQTAGGKTGAATHQHPRWADRLVQPPPLGASAASSVRQLPPLPGQRHADLDGYRSFQNHQRYFRPCAGDEALAALAEELLIGLRNVDIVGRYGGDEFGAVLPNTSAEQAETVLRRIQQRLDAVIFKEAPQLRLQISAGIANYHPRWAVIWTG